MVSPYRAGQPPKNLDCPRCAKPLPPTDVAACLHGCGTWISQFAATELLDETDMRLDPVTRWWRVRSPCPICREQMQLYGDDPGLLQGCAQHGFFIDADTIEHTGLAKGIDVAAIERKRADVERVQAERERLAEVAERRRQLELQKERAESELRKKLEAMNAEDRAKHAAAQRQAQVARLMSAGATAALADYILELEERIHTLERYLRRASADS
jgi:hypothetical protein